MTHFKFALLVRKKKYSVIANSSGLFKIEYSTTMCFYCWAIFCNYHSKYSRICSNYNWLTDWLKSVEIRDELVLLNCLSSFHKLLNTVTQEAARTSFALEHQFSATVKHWTFREALYSVFLLNNFHIHAYKVHLTYELKSTGLWVGQQRAVVHLSNNIIFSNDAHFQLDGFVDKMVAFGIQKIYKLLLTTKYIHNASLFGTAWGFI